MRKLDDSDEDSWIPMRHDYMKRSCWISCNIFPRISLHMFNVHQASFPDRAKRARNGLKDMNNYGYFKFNILCIRIIIWLKSADREVQCTDSIIITAAFK